jgi:hypothetical protein
MSFTHCAGQKWLATASSKVNLPASFACSGHHIRAEMMYGGRCAAVQSIHLLLAARLRFNCQRNPIIH